jgi:hypothetical protein
MALWQKLWLLFTVLWVVVGGLQVMSILVFSDGELEREKALLPLVFIVVVPAAAYALGWIWAKVRKSRQKQSGSEPN